MKSAVDDGLRLLAGRELSVEQLRDRLLDREHAREDVDAAIDHLIETGSLDDNRVARAHARTAANVKGRGRLRVLRELSAKGISREIAAEAVADVFGGLDERSLVQRAIQKKLRGHKPATTRADRARLYQHLMRQGFSPAAIRTALGETRDDSDS